MDQFIYKLVNLDNQKVYIGRTTRPKSRAKEHLYSIRRHKHINRLVNNDSECKFEFEIIERVPKYSDAVRKEREYMQLYRSYDEQFGYNALDSKVQTLRRDAGLPYWDNSSKAREKRWQKLP